MLMVSLEAALRAEGMAYELVMGAPAQEDKHKTARQIEA